MIDLLEEPEPQQPKPSPTPSPMKGLDPNKQYTPDEYEDALADLWGMPKNLLKAHHKMESYGGKQYDASGKVLEGPAADKEGNKAVGKYQLMRQTAKEMGYDPEDPYMNIYMGMSKLKHHYEEGSKKFDDDNERWAYALTRYHGGNVDKNGNITGKDVNITTGNYVQQIMKDAGMLDEQEEPEAAAGEAPGPERRALPGGRPGETYLASEPPSEVSLRPDEYPDSKFAGPKPEVVPGSAAYAGAPSLKTFRKPVKGQPPPVQQPIVEGGQPLKLGKLTGKPTGYENIKPYPKPPPPSKFPALPMAKEDFASRVQKAREAERIQGPVELKAPAFDRQAMEAGIAGMDIPDLRPPRGQEPGFLDKPEYAGLTPAAKAKLEMLGQTPEEREASLEPPDTEAIRKGLKHQEQVDLFKNMEAPYFIPQLGIAGTVGGETGRYLKNFGVGAATTGSQIHEAARNIHDAFTSAAKEQGKVIGLGELPRTKEKFAQFTDANIARSAKMEKDKLEIEGTLAAASEADPSLSGASTRVLGQGVSQAMILGPLGYMGAAAGGPLMGSILAQGAQATSYDWRKDPRGSALDFATGFLDIPIGKAAATASQGFLKGVKSPGTKEAITYGLSGAASGAGEASQDIISGLLDYYEGKRTLQSVFEEAGSSFIGSMPLGWVGAHQAMGTKPGPTVVSRTAAPGAGGGVGTFNLPPNLGTDLFGPAGTGTPPPTGWKPGPGGPPTGGGGGGGGGVSPSSFVGPVKQSTIYSPLSDADLLNQMGNKRSPEEDRQYLQEVALRGETFRTFARDTIAAREVSDQAAAESALATERGTTATTAYERSVLKNLINKGSLYATDVEFGGLQERHPDIFNDENMTITKQGKRIKMTVTPAGEAFLKDWKAGKVTPRPETTAAPTEQTPPTEPTIVEPTAPPTETAPTTTEPAVTEPPVTEPTVPSTEVPPTEAPKPAASSGELNTVFTKETYEAGRNEFLDAFKEIGDPTKMNIPSPDITKLMSGLFKMGGYHTERGLRTFKEWSEAMLAEAGQYADQVKEHLPDIYRMLRRHHGGTPGFEGLSTDEEIAAHLAGPAPAEQPAAQPTAQPAAPAVEPAKPEVKQHPLERRKGELQGEMATLDAEMAEGKLQPAQERANRHKYNDLLNKVDAIDRQLAASQPQPVAKPEPAQTEQPINRATTVMPTQPSKEMSRAEMLARIKQIDQEVADLEDAVDANEPGAHKQSLNLLKEKMDLMVKTTGQPYNVQTPEKPKAKTEGVKRAEHELMPQLEQMKPGDKHEQNLTQAELKLLRRWNDDKGGSTSTGLFIQERKSLSAMVQGKKKVIFTRVEPGTSIETGRAATKTEKPTKSPSGRERIHPPLQEGHEKPVPGDYRRTHQYIAADYIYNKEGQSGSFALDPDVQRAVGREPLSSWIIWKGKAAAQGVEPSPQALREAGSQAIKAVEKHLMDRFGVDHLKEISPQEIRNWMREQGWTPESTPWKKFDALTEAQGYGRTEGTEATTGLTPPVDKPQKKKESKREQIAKQDYYTTQKEDPEIKKAQKEAERLSPGELEGMKFDEQGNPADEHSMTVAKSVAKFAPPGADPLLTKAGELTPEGVRHVQRVVAAGIFGGDTAGNNLVRALVGDPLIGMEPSFDMKTVLPEPTRRAIMANIGAFHALQAEIKSHKDAPKILLQAMRDWQVVLKTRMDPNYTGDFSADQDILNATLDFYGKEGRPLSDLGGFMDTYIKTLKAAPRDNTSGATHKGVLQVAIEDYDAKYKATNPERARVLDGATQTEDRATKGRTKKAEAGDRTESEAEGPEVEPDQEEAGTQARVVKGKGTGAEAGKGREAVPGEVGKVLQTMRNPQREPVGGKVRAEEKMRTAMQKAPQHVRDAHQVTLDHRTIGLSAEDYDKAVDNIILGLKSQSTVHISMVHGLLAETHPPIGSKYKSWLEGPATEKPYVSQMVMRQDGMYVPRTDPYGLPVFHPSNWGNGYTSRQWSRPDALKRNGLNGAELSPRMMAMVDNALGHQRMSLGLVIHFPTPDASNTLVRVLNEWAEDYESGGFHNTGIREFADHIQRSADAGKSVLLLTTDQNNNFAPAGFKWDAATFWDYTVPHELLHYSLFKATNRHNPIGGAWVANLPELETMRAGLAKEKGVQPADINNTDLENEMWAYFGTKEFDKLGLTPEQAESVLSRYLFKLKETYGPDIFDQMIYKGGYIEGLLKGIGNAQYWNKTQKNAGNAGTATQGQPTSNQRPSGVPAVAEESVGSTESRGGLGDSPDSTGVVPSRSEPGRFRQDTIKDADGKERTLGLPSPMAEALDKLVAHQMAGPGGGVGIPGRPAPPAPTAPPRSVLSQLGDVLSTITSFNQLGNIRFGERNWIAVAQNFALRRNTDRLTAMYDSLFSKATGRGRAFELAPRSGTAMGPGGVLMRNPRKAEHKRSRNRAWNEAKAAKTARRTGTTPTISFASTPVAPMSTLPILQGKLMTPVRKGMVAMEQALDWGNSFPDDITERYHRILTYLSLNRMYQNHLLAQPTATPEQQRKLSELIHRESVASGEFWAYRMPNAISGGLHMLKGAVNLMGMAMTRPSIWRQFKNDPRGVISTAMDQRFGLGDVASGVRYHKIPGGVATQGFQGVFGNPVILSQMILDYKDMRTFELAHQADPDAGHDIDADRARVKMLGAAAKMTIGGGVSLIGAMLYHLGVMEEDWSENENVQRVQRDTGHRPFAFNVSKFMRLISHGGSVLSYWSSPDRRAQNGDVLIDYHLFQPPAVWLALGVAGMDAWLAHKRGEGKGVSGALWKGMRAGTNAADSLLSLIFGQRYLTDATNAISFSKNRDAPGYATRFLRSVLENAPIQVVPGLGSSMLYQMRGVTDPYMREARTERQGGKLVEDADSEDFTNLAAWARAAKTGFVKYPQSRLPFLGEGIKSIGLEREPYALNALGKRRELIPGEASRSKLYRAAMLLSPVGVTHVNEEPVESEMMRLETAPGMPGKRQGESEDDRRERTAIRGRYILEAGNRMVQDPEWRSIPKPQKISLLRGIFRQGTAAANAAIPKAPGTAGAPEDEY